MSWKRIITIAVIVAIIILIVMAIRKKRREKDPVTEIKKSLQQGQTKKASAEQKEPVYKKSRDFLDRRGRSALEKLSPGIDGRVTLYDAQGNKILVREND